MSEASLIALYSEALLALAADIPHVGRLSAPQMRVEKRAPMCGSKIAVEICTDSAGRITAFAQEPRACALGQAAASVVGAAALGLGLADVAAGEAALMALLREGAPPPPGPFAGFAPLAAAREVPSRHGSILLAISALREALERAAAGTPSD